MSIDDKERSFPKSVRQRKVLDVAAENPNASIEELASMVPSADPDLVERVLEEHGDPASDGGTEDPGASATGNDDEGEKPTATDSETAGTGTASVTTDSSELDVGTDDTEPDAGSAPTVEELSAKQRAVLEHVAAEPSATQQEIGDRLDVSAATVSNRVNSIEGFDWGARAAFVDGVFDETPNPAVQVDGGATNEEATGTDQMDSVETPHAEPEHRTDIETTLDQLEERMTDLEDTLERMATDDESPLEDPELVHKMVHACMESDNIDETEELEILQALLG
jgi:hypothetical protein